MTVASLGALNARVAAALESGRFDGAVATSLSRLWARRARVSRQLDLPETAAVIGVGGSTLGGSYKTPLVLAIARGLGERVSVVASSYASRLGRPRRIAPDDAVTDVGDEALWLARSLWPLGVPVVAGADRAAAIHLAASLSPRVVVDSLLQTHPVPLAFSILAVDGERPWGAGKCPPSGDLRAPAAALLAAADAVVRVHGAGPAAPGGEHREFVATHALTHAEAASGSVDLAALGHTDVGLVTAVARPDRILQSLAEAGVRPARVRRFADHGVPRAARGAGPALWLTTPKCATKMGPVFEGAPVYVLQHALALPAALLDVVSAVTSERVHRETTLCTK